jgi:hypothetical protein
MSTQEELIGEWMPPPEGGGLPIDNEDYIAQVRQNCRLDLPNVKQAMPHKGIMIMVCGGPTSKLYLEDIRKKSEDSKYKIFCSNGTHDWLISNGIIPDYHFIIDPKKSMLDYVKNPHKDVEYLIGSCCCPEVFEKLKGFNLKRLMVFSGSQSLDGMTDMQIIQTMYGKHEYAPLEGGTMAGLRAIPLGNIFGYETIEFYGFDSCFFVYGEDGTPVFYSYDKKRIENVMECKTDDGRAFDSTPVFASQARQFIKWKNKYEWMKLIIHGDSLTAAVDKLNEEARKPKHDLLITDYFLKMNQELHKDVTVEFGSVGNEYAGEIALLAGQIAKKNGEITLLDYGCGRGTLKDVFPDIKGVTFYEFDPCIEEKSQRPEPADLVVCTDVLEHIEPECLENVLDDLQRLTKKVCFVSVCLTKAAKFYSDGQNCHLSVLPEDIWYAKLRKRFDIVEMDKKTSRRHHNVVYVLQKKGGVK